MLAFGFSMVAFGRFKAGVGQAAGLGVQVDAFFTSRHAFDTDVNQNTSRAGCQRGHTDGFTFKVFQLGRQEGM